MTICVAVKVNDCTVFAADSASSLMGPDANGQMAIIKVFDHGNKVFNIYKGLPICAMTSGMGNIGDSSIATLAKDFRMALQESSGKYYIDKDKYTLADVSNKAFEFLYNEKYKGLKSQPQGDHSFEFQIGGYDSTGASEIWRIRIINGQCSGAELVSGNGVSGIQWSGQPDAINRLILGYAEQLQTALAGAGMSAGDVQKLLTTIAQHTQAPVVYPSMPVQDAIRLADFLVETTKGFVSFLPGADTVGGDTDVAVVTKHEGFKWIRRKHYYPRDLNPLETDHV